MYVRGFCQIKGSKLRGSIAVTNFFDVFHNPVCKVQNAGGETLYKATVRQRESPFLNR